jgi:hypothetical protein
MNRVDGCQDIQAFQQREARSVNLGFFQDAPIHGDPLSTPKALDIKA